MFFFVSLFLQTGKYFFLQDSYINGIRVDFLALSIYLSDVLSLIVIFVYLVTNRGASKQIYKSITKHKTIIVVLLAVIIINVLSSSIEFITFFKIIKVINLSTGIYTLTRYINKRTSRYFFWLSITILFTSLFLGFFQYITGHSIGGLFYLLGERSMSLTNVGISLININGKEFLRPYSFFPHPNVFAGLIVMMIFLAMRFAKLSKIVIMILLLPILFFLSKGAFVGLLGVLFLSILMFSKIKRKIIATLTVSIVLLINIVVGTLSFYPPSNLSKELSERAYLNKISIEHSLSSYFSPKGYGTSPIKTGKLYLYQPTHNILFLLVEEWGAFGFVGYVFLMYLLYVSIDKNIYLNSAMIFFIFLTGTMDHYWLTLQQGIAVIILTILLCLKDNKSHEE